MKNQSARATASILPGLVEVRPPDSSPASAQTRHDDGVGQKYLNPYLFLNPVRALLSPEVAPKGKTGIGSLNSRGRGDPDEEGSV